jgi:putative membrane protein
VLKFLLKVVLMAGVFYAMTLFLDGVEVTGNEEAPLGITGTFLWIALLFAVINAIVGPILRMLSLPFILLSLGLFLLLINAALLGLTAALTDRLDVNGFIPAVLGGLVLAVGGWIADQLLGR